MMLPVTTSGGEGPLPPSAITGVAQERVDPSTLQLLDALFPGHHGLEFAARILRLAEAKQIALPELGFSEIGEMAVITIQSIRTLAKLIGWSYDTTEKYLVVLCCLRLLYKQRSRQQILLYFPLRPCQLPEPEALDRIAELRPGKRTPRYREKVRSFASQVKRRFVLLRKGGRTELAIASPSVVPLSDASLVVPGLMEEIHLILQQEVDSEVASRLFLKIEGAVRYRCAQSRLSLQKGDADGEMCSFQQQKSPVGCEKDDSEGDAPGQQRLLFSKKGDSDGETCSFQQQESSFDCKKGDSQQGISSPQSRLFGKKGDSAPRHVFVEGTLQEQQSPSFPEKGDAVPELCAQKSRLAFPKGDSLESPRILQERKATFSEPQGDSVDNTSDNQSRLFWAKGDSGRERCVSDDHKATRSRPQGDFLEQTGAGNEQESPFHPGKGDSMPGTPTGSLNVNDSNNYISITQEKNVNVNDPTAQAPRCGGREAARIGQQLAHFLDNGANAGGFVNKVKACGPMIIQAAVIDLLVHQAFPLVDPTDLRGRPMNKAGWFHGACNRFAVPGTPLPAYVTKWVSTGSSWQQIQQELEQAAAKYEQYLSYEQTADLVRTWLRGRMTEQELDAQLLLVEQQRLGSLPPGSLSQGSVVLDMSKLSMNEEQARLLASVMPGELDAFCDEVAAMGGQELPRGAKAVAKQKQGEVWEVELSWKMLPFPVSFASLLRWRQYLEEQLQGEKWDLERAARKAQREARHGTSV